MTLPDEKLNSIYAFERAIASLYIKPWPKAKEGRELLRRVLRHYPLPHEIVLGLFPHGSKDAKAAGCICESHVTHRGCPVHDC